MADFNALGNDLEPQLPDGTPVADGENPTDGTFPTDVEQPDTQGDDPLEAELGEDGQGDIDLGDLADPSGDAPRDLRVEE